MADNGSPSQDEIERQNECLKACGDAFLAIEQVWANLFNDKKITLERTQKELKQCSKDHSLCCDQCVPRKRRFTDDQKHDFGEGGKALLGAAAISAIAAAGAGALFEAPEAEVFILGVGTAVALISIVAFKLNDQGARPGQGRMPTVR